MIRQVPGSSSSTPERGRRDPAGARMWGALIVVLVAAAAVLLWWGLGGGAADRSGPSGPTRSVSPDAAAPSLQPSSTAPGSMSKPAPDPDLLEGGGEPTWSTPTSAAAASAQAAQDAVWVQRATTFLEAFARPPAGGSSGQWWQRVRPLMSAQAAQDYAATDPARVRFTTVTGAGAVVEPDAGADDEGSVQVGVPTDDGWYLVSFDRAGAVTRVAPVPGSVSVAGQASGPGVGGDGARDGGRGSPGARS